MRLTTYSGTTIDTSDGWHLVAKCALGHLRRAAFVMLDGERNETKIDAIFDGFVKIVDAAEEIGNALGWPWAHEMQED